MRLATDMGCWRWRGRTKRRAKGRIGSASATAGMKLRFWARGCGWAQREAVDVCARCLLAREGNSDTGLVARLGGANSDIVERRFDGRPLTRGGSLRTDCHAHGHLARPHRVLDGGGDCTHHHMDSEKGKAIMISAIIIMAVVLVISGTANFVLADINNKLDLTNEDLMEENEVLREKMRSNWDI